MFGKKTGNYFPLPNNYLQAGIVPRKSEEGKSRGDRIKMIREKGREG